MSASVTVRYTGEGDLPVVTDQDLARARQDLRSYTVVILRKGPAYRAPDAGFTSDVAKIIWAHGRRNAALRTAGLMPVVCPVADGSDVSGVGILDADPEEAGRIMSMDPGVRAGVFTYEVHPARSFPGSRLPD